MEWVKQRRPKLFNSTMCIVPVFFCSSCQAYYRHCLRRIRFCDQDECCIIGKDTTCKTWSTTEPCHGPCDKNGCGLSVCFKVSSCKECKPATEIV